MKTIGLALLGILLVVASMDGQTPEGRPAVLRGFILADSTEEPLVDAEVSIDAANLRVRSASTGAFRLAGIAPGTYIVSVRVIGYQRLSTRLRFADGDSLERDFLLVRSPVAIAAVRVTGATSTRNPKLAQMERRRSMGIGHFLTPERLDSFPDTRLSVHMQTLPGLSIAHGNGSTATWAVGTRGSGSILKVPAISRYDRARGAKSGVCYSAVYLDGIVVYGGKLGETLFEIDQLQTRDVAAIEYYASAAQMPPELNMTTSGTCGVVVIWTR